MPDIEAGITVTEDNLYVNYNGTDYELGEEAFAQLQEQQAAAAPEDSEGLGFKESCEQAIEAQGGDAAACDFDVTAWFSELENEGTEDVGGAEATHIAGVARRRADGHRPVPARRVHPRRDGRGRSLADRAAARR